MSDITIRESECYRQCGYAAPVELMDRHEREDHAPCGVCGQRPRNPYPVAHLDGCTRLTEIRAFEAEWTPAEPPLAVEESR
jgi:hypothetical protein